jgi:hypothetical protein
MLMGGKIRILLNNFVAQVVGFIKGKNAISIARTNFCRRRNFTGQSFWARGCYMPTEEGKQRKGSHCHSF